MPIDKNAEEEDLREERRRRAYTDYDCPSCNANNPTEMALRDGEETRSNYCGRAHTQPHTHSRQSPAATKGAVTPRPRPPPKITGPTRTTVAPSSMAVSKSWVLPIDRP